MDFYISLPRLHGILSQTQLLDKNNSTNYFIHDVVISNYLGYKRNGKYQKSKKQEPNYSTVFHMDKMHYFVRLLKLWLLKQVEN